MNRLSKFEERGAYGEGPGRVAYALVTDRLPEPAPRMEWCLVSPFSVADEILANPRMKGSFQRRAC